MKTINSRSNTLMKAHEKLVLAVALAVLTRFALAQAGEIHIAVGAGNLEKVKILLDADNNSINAMNEYGQTPLVLAVIEGRNDMVQLLLDRGANIETKDSRFGVTPLFWAINTETIKLLLDKGANIEAKDKIGNTPLIDAVSKAFQNGDIDKIRVLLDRKADLEAINNSGGTALMTAAGNGNATVVKLLMDGGPTSKPSVTTERQHCSFRHQLTTPTQQW